MSFPFPPFSSGTYIAVVLPSFEMMRPMNSGFSKSALRITAISLSVFGTAVMSGLTFNVSASTVTLSMVVKLDTSRAATPLIFRISSVILCILPSVSEFRMPFSFWMPRTIMSSYRPKVFSTSSFQTRTSDVGGSMFLGFVSVRTFGNWVRKRSVRTIERATMSLGWSTENSTRENLRMHTSCNLNTRITIFAVSTLKSQVHVRRDHGFFIVFCGIGNLDAVYQLFWGYIEQRNIQWAGKDRGALGDQHEEQVFNAREVHFFHLLHHGLTLFLRLVRQAFEVLHLFLVDRVDAPGAEEHRDPGAFPQKAQRRHKGVIDLTQFVVKAHDGNVFYYLGHGSFLLLWQLTQPPFHLP